MNRKLLFVYYSCGIGGGQSKLRNRLKLLSKNGYDCEIIFYWSGDGSQWFSEFNTNILTAQKPKSFNILPQLANKTVDIISHNRYDCIISFDHHLIQALKSKGYPGKLIYEHIYPTWFSNLETINQYAPDGIIVPTIFHHDIIKKYLKSPTPIYIIPNSIGEEFLLIANPYDNIKTYIQPVTLTKRNTNDHYNTSKPAKQKSIIAWVGRMVKVKNFHEFIRISNQLITSDQDFEYWVVTNAKNSKIYKKIKQASKSSKFHKIISHFKVLNNLPISKMPYLYSAVANSGGCVVSTSKAESFGNVYMEAMACKCPMITANGSAGKEIVKNGITGLVYQSGNIYQACNQINKIATDLTLREQLVNTAYETIISTHHENVTLNAFDSMMNEILY